MRKSSQAYDSGLNEIAHYKSFPLMRPFVGELFSSSEVKTLLVAESFYLPNDCELHKDAEKWYHNDESGLADDEKAWINCRELIECDWFADGHFIYKELDRCLIESRGIGFEGVAYMNAFQRPSCKEGESFKDFCTEMDVEKAVEVINSVQRVLQPEQVIFVAKYPWDKLGSSVTSCGVASKYDFVCHPGTGGRYWHNVNYQHGKRKFIQLMRPVGEQGG